MRFGSFRAPRWKACGAPGLMASKTLNPKPNPKGPKDLIIRVPLKGSIRGLEDFIGVLRVQRT